MMRKLVVHAGPHKTGTTYIQSLLHNNKEVLINHGVCYPEVYYLYLGHHYLLNELNGKASCEEVRDKINGALQGGDTCVLSSENFISLSDVGLKKIKEAFPEAEISFVIYLRRPSLRLVSRWHEEVKQGGVQSLESFYMEHSLRPMQSREINLSHYINKVINIFGRQGIKLVDYDSANQSKTMMQNFQKAAGIDFLISDVDAEVNKMSSLAEIEMIRAINFLASQDGKLRGSNVREKFYSIKKSDDEFRGSVKKLEDGISDSSRCVNLGDTIFDMAFHKIVEENYKDILINKLSAVRRESVFYPSTDWLLHAEKRTAVDKLAKIVVEKLG